MTNIIDRVAYLFLPEDNIRIAFINRLDPFHNEFIKVTGDGEFRILGTTLDECLDSLYADILVFRHEGKWYSFCEELLQEDYHQDDVVQRAIKILEVSY